MSANIEIIQEEDKGVEITIRVNSIQLQVFEFYGKYTQFIFDMTKETHRQAVKKLVEVLQRQLEVHGVE
jgi:hypothetical protein